MRDRRARSRRSWRRWCGGPGRKGRCSSRAAGRRAGGESHPTAPAFPPRRKPSRRDRARRHPASRYFVTPSGSEGPGGVCGATRQPRSAARLRVIPPNRLRLPLADLHGHLVPLRAGLDVLRRIEAEDELRAELVLDLAVDAEEVGRLFDVIDVAAGLAAEL